MGGPLFPPPVLGGGKTNIPHLDYNKNRMKRANIKILALILALIVLPPLMWELKSQVGVVPGSGGVPNDAVQGGSNLTVTGTVPYVCSTGTLCQDGSFLRSATGRYTLYDPTATTGVTTLTVRAGAGQSTTQLQQWSLSNGTVFAYVDPLNQSVNSGAFRIGNASGGFWNSSGFSIPSNATALWSTTTNAATGSWDLGLARSSANNLGITNGGATTYATIGADNNGALITTVTRTLSAGVTDAYTAGISIAPTYSGAFTVTRHNYINALNPVLQSSAVLTDATLVRFDAAAGTHKAVDSGTTKTTPGTVDAWIKVNINGTIYYIPVYTSKTT